MNAQEDAGVTPMSEETIRENFKARLVALFNQEVNEIAVFSREAKQDILDWSSSYAVAKNKAGFDIRLETGADKLEEWMRPAFAEILGTVRTRLGDVSVHHMDVQTFPWEVYFNTRAVFPAVTVLSFYFNPEAIKPAPEPEQKKSWLSSLLGRPKSAAPAPEKKSFTMTLE